MSGGKILKTGVCLGPGGGSDWETGTGTDVGPHGVHGMERHLRRCICSVGFGEKVRSEFYRVRRRRKMTAIMEEGGASSGFVS